jgi:non-specific serine/threonine protein kinase
MAEVTRVLGGTRLLTLTGPGGTGKTRLALQVAADLLARYPQGVWLVELAPLADPALVPQAVATVLGVQEDASRSLVAALTEALRPKHILLLLDNCEHLLDACAQLAEALLRGCAHLSILATSREALGIAGETAWRVPSLALPDPRHLPPRETLAQCEAVRLFMDRALAAQPHFLLTDHNAPAVVQLCHRLDGIPLAIELAAARLRGLSVEQLAARLDQRFRLLTGGSRTALPRQQTLQAMVDWSYSLLSVPEQTLFARLSVFTGGFTLEAAEMVCAGDPITDEDVLDLLLRLIDKSLIDAEDGPDGIERYRLLETLRQYGRERLVAGGTAAALRERHAAYFLALAEQAVPALRGREHAAWLQRLEQEHDNLRAALAWWLGAEEQPGQEESGARAEAGLRLAGALWGFWFHRGYRGEGLRWLEQALGQSGGAPSTRAAALTGAEDLTWYLGDGVRGRALLAESVALFRTAGERRGLADALAFLGFIMREQDHARGTALLEESITIARAVGGPGLIGWTLMCFAFDADLEQAEERARAGSRRRGHHPLAGHRRYLYARPYAACSRSRGPVRGRLRARAGRSGGECGGHACRGGSPRGGDRAGPAGRCRPPARRRPGCCCILRGKRRVVA